MVTDAEYYRLLDRLTRMEKRMHLVETALERHRKALSMLAAAGSSDLAKKLMAEAFEAGQATGTEQEKG